MLDFYLIKDDHSQPAYPEQAGLVFAGELDEQTYSHLQRKGVIDARFDFYSDFRLYSELITQMRQHIITHQLQADSGVKQLLVLLDMAEEQQSGLIAYGD